MVGGQHECGMVYLGEDIPGNIVKFLPSIFLNVNWLKVRERVMGRLKANRISVKNERVLLQR